MAVVALLIAGAGELTVNVKVADPVPLALVAPNVTVEIPTAVGVPVIFPVDVLIAKPAGNPVALKLVGLLLAVVE